MEKTAQIDCAGRAAYIRYGKTVDRTPVSPEHDTEIAQVSARLFKFALHDSSRPGIKWGALQRETATRISEFDRPRLPSLESPDIWGLAISSPPSTSHSRCSPSRSRSHSPRVTPETLTPATTLGPDSCASSVHCKISSRCHDSHLPSSPRRNPSFRLLCPRSPHPHRSRPRHPPSPATSPPTLLSIRDASTSLTTTLARLAALRKSLSTTLSKSFGLLHLRRRPHSATRLLEHLFRLWKSLTFLSERINLSRIIYSLVLDEVATAMDRVGDLISRGESLAEGIEGVRGRKGRKDEIADETTNNKRKKLRMKPSPRRIVREEFGPAMQELAEQEVWVEELVRRATEQVEGG